METLLRRFAGKRMPRDLPVLQPDVWPRPPRPPRAKPRVMMHLVDSGWEWAEYRCRKCGHEMEAEVEDGPRGGTSHYRTRPCPRCNGKETGT